MQEPVENPHPETQKPRRLVNALEAWDAEASPPDFGEK
jgi:hypothetical protein